MKELNRFETFKEYDEIDDVKLIIDENSECYYIENNGNKYLAWKKVDSITNMDSSGDIMEYENSYYSVLDGECVLRETVLENKDGIISGRIAKVQAIKDILGLTGNKKYILDEEDVMTFTDFKEEKAENPRKTYF